MIRISDNNGQSHLVNPTGILQVQEVAASSQWHGIRAYVRLLDGRTIEARETIDHIAGLIKSDRLSAEKDGE